MDVTFYGVRGSFPIARRDQLRYGGNTTCLHFQTQSGCELILDGGSGVRLLGKQMMQGVFGKGEGHAYIAVGHTHWDHILGYPFFDPFYVAGNRFEVVSAGQKDDDICDILRGQQTDLHFPISVEAFSSELTYRTFTPGDAIALGDFRLETVQLNHPGITVGYRIEADGVVATVFTDTGRIRKTRIGEGMGGPEPDGAFTEQFLDELAFCARESDLLVHDTQYFEEEMLGRFAWGHSTVEDALEMAYRAQVKQLALFHYAPNHSDTIVDEQLVLAHDLNRDPSLNIIASYEGLQLTVGQLSTTETYRMA